MYNQFIDKKITYDGTQLSSLWAYKNFGIQGDSIVSFIGPCDVPITHMVDMADVRDGDFIYSELMLHFIAEHFDMNLEKAVLRQRMLISIIKETIEHTITNINIIRRGDDLFIGNGKLSVSIATVSPVSTMIHTGVNIRKDNTPVLTSCLGDLNIEPAKLGQQICQNYCDEMESVFMARCKVRSVV